VPRRLSILAVVVGVGVVQWLVFHNPVSGVMTTIIGVGLFSGRRPSRWLYVPSAAAFVAALAIAPFNHTHQTDLVGSLLLAAGCAGLVATFGARFWLPPEIYEDTNA
jgi:hypothetical protein